MADAAAPAAQDDGGEEAPHPRPLARCPGLPPGSTVAMECVRSYRRQCSACVLRRNLSVKAVWMSFRSRIDGRGNNGGFDELVTEPPK